MLSCHKGLRYATVRLGWAVLFGCGLTFTATAQDEPDKSQAETTATQEANEKSAPDDSMTLAEIIAPASLAEVDQAIARGVDFLIANQNKNGSWGSPTNTKDLNIYAPVPGAHHAFGTATTALAIAALCELEQTRPDAKESIERGQAWLLEHLPKLRRASKDAIYNVWGHGYGIQALVRLHKRTDDVELQKKLVELIELQFDRLSDYESVDGGWGYYDFNVGAQKPTASSTSFVNATILIAFHEAKEMGVQPPERLTRRAVDATMRQQKADFSYMYGEYLKNRPMQEINRPGGSLGRSQACNLAMRFWGDAGEMKHRTDCTRDAMWATLGIAVLFVLGQALGGDWRIGLALGLALCWIADGFRQRAVWTICAAAVVVPLALWLSRDWHLPFIFSVSYLPPGLWAIWAERKGERERHGEAAG